MQLTPKIIQRPDVPGMRRLSPLETNAIKLSTRRTLLTAEYLEKLRRHEPLPTAGAPLRTPPGASAQG